jgi:hypothetical protein
MFTTSFIIVFIMRLVHIFNLPRQNFQLVTEAGAAPWNPNLARIEVEMEKVGLFELWYHLPHGRGLTVLMKGLCMRSSTRFVSLTQLTVLFQYMSVQCISIFIRMLI